MHAHLYTSYYYELRGSARETLSFWASGELDVYVELTDIDKITFILHCNLATILGLGELLEFCQDAPVVSLPEVLLWQPSLAAPSNQDSLMHLLQLFLSPWLDSFTAERTRREDGYKHKVG